MKEKNVIEACPLVQFSIFFMFIYRLRYQGRWIDSVWKSRSYAGTLKENPINLYIF